MHLSAKRDRSIFGKVPTMKQFIGCVGSVALVLGVFSSPALASGITVTNGGSTAWILLPNSIGNGGAGT